jgi:hypothetical protein
MEPKSDPIKEILSELFGLLETSETQTLAILQFLKDEGIATEEKLAPYLERAGNASSVRWRAARARMEYLLTPQGKKASDKDSEKKDEVKSETKSETTSEAKAEPKDKKAQEAVKQSQETAAQSPQKAKKPQQTGTPEKSAAKKPEALKATASGDNSSKS